MQGNRAESAWKLHSKKQWWNAIHFRWRSAKATWQNLHDIFSFACKTLIKLNVCRCKSKVNIWYSIEFFSSFIYTLIQTARHALIQLQVESRVSGRKNWLTTQKIPPTHGVNWSDSERKKDMIVIRFCLECAEKKTWFIHTRQHVTRAVSRYII